MKSFVKCEMCTAETPTDKCVFATHKKVIEGKEYTFCCPTMRRKFMFNRTAIDPEDSKKGKKKSRKAHTK